MAKWSEAQKRYAKSLKGLEARRKYQMSEKAKKIRKDYLEKRKIKLQETKQPKTEINYVPIKEKSTEIKRSKE